MGFHGTKELQFSSSTGSHVVVGASDHVVPFGDFLVEGLGLLAVMLQRVSAQGEVHRWLRRAGEVHNGRSQFYRIARLMVADLGTILLPAAGSDQSRSFESDEAIALFSNEAARVSMRQRHRAQG